MKRQENLVELMDDPHANPELLHATYQQFKQVNSWFAGWNTLYIRYIAPLFTKQRKPLSILDIGAGPGDILLGLIQRATKDGRHLQATGIDPDPRAAAFQQAHRAHARFEYLTTSDQKLADSGERFDVVISNHLLHHLTPDQIQHLCLNAMRLSKSLILFNDIHRNRLAYLLFRCLIPLAFRNSFVWEDGSRSILRSYTAGELQAIVPEGWHVIRFHPFRLLVYYAH